MADYSTPRVSRFRKHENNDHTSCHPDGPCAVMRQLWQDNEAHLRAVALFAELENRGIEPRKFLGVRRFKMYQERIDASFPESEHLPTEPDFVHRLQARNDLADPKRWLP